LKEKECIISYFTLLISSYEHQSLLSQEDFKKRRGSNLRKLEITRALCSFTCTPKTRAIAEEIYFDAKVLTVVKNPKKMLLFLE
jgi:hypothetical protein